MRRDGHDDIGHNLRDSQEDGDKHEHDDTDDRDGGRPL